MTENQTQAPEANTPVAAELSAMTAVSEALEPLDPAAQRRVIGWAADRFGATRAEAQAGLASAAGAQPVAHAGEQPATTYADFPEMFYAARPRDDEERLLAAGYWLQTQQGERDLHADNVNELLTPLGERIDRVRDVLPRLFNSEPALAIRAGRGRGTRSRVLFRLTAPGIGIVDAALAAGGFSNLG